MDCGSSGFCSDSQIFNRSELRQMNEDGTFGLLAPEPLGEGGPDLYYFLLGDNAFALMPWMVKPYSRRQFKRQEIIFANYRRLVENVFGILVSRFQVLLGTMGQRPRVVRDIVYACVVLHNIMRTHLDGADRSPNPGYGGAALQNNHAACVPDENYWNPSREAKHQ